MTLVIFGIDALDPDLVDSEKHPHLVLDAHSHMETIVSSAGSPSTHELWPTIITGQRPEEHGLELDDGVSWENPLFAIGSSVADYILPANLQMRLGAWLLNRTTEDAFRVPATYYEKNGLTTLFDEYTTKTIGIPNYVTDPDDEDREHSLRREMGSLFERDPDAQGGHRSADPVRFYELCMEMSMVRITRTRRALRSRQFELVFGYTSGLDLIGHVAYDNPTLQRRAYDELDHFIGELRDDLSDNDELVLVSDHGLQNGVHTHEAIIAATIPSLVAGVDGVLDIRKAIENELEDHDYNPDPVDYEEREPVDDEAVREQLKDLGYM